MPPADYPGPEAILFDESAIFARLDTVAQAITADYRGSEILALAILHGSLIFMADLLRRIPLPMRIETLTVSSYHGGRESSGTVTFQQALPNLEGQHVLILDDILDTGRTLHAVRERVKTEARPASIGLCVLLQKRKPRAHPICPNYVGFKIDDEFVVGYGLDYRGHYRNLPYIGILNEPALP